MKVRPVAFTGNLCGEGAVWDAPRETLWWVDINRFTVSALTGGAVRTWDMGEPATALSLAADDRLLVALRRDIVLWDPESDRRDVLATLQDPGCRFNDGRTDPAGRFWIGTMADNVGPDGAEVLIDPGHGKLYRLGKGLEPQVTGVGIANTLAWSPDAGRFYFADSMANLLQRFDYDRAAGTISNPVAHLADHPRGVPDGSAMDAEGCLWTCRYDGGCIIRTRPDGSIERVVDLPVRKPTTACFGGPDLSTLFVTSAANSRAPDDRLAGCVLAIETTTRGLPENRFDPATCG